MVDASCLQLVRKTSTFQESCTICANTESDFANGGAPGVSGALVFEPDEIPMLGSDFGSHKFPRPADPSMHLRVIYVFPRKLNNRRMISRIVPFKGSALRAQARHREKHPCKMAFDAPTNYRRRTCATACSSRASSGSTAFEFRKAVRRQVH